MGRNERQTCIELIDPALRAAGWAWDREVVIGPGRVNLSGEGMYDPTQRLVADYVPRIFNMPLAVLEAKAEGEPAADGMQQGSRYAARLQVRFSIASNGRVSILTDNADGTTETLAAAPTPDHLLGRLGLAVDWAR